MPNNGSHNYKWIVFIKIYLVKLKKHYGNTIMGTQFPVKVIGIVYIKCFHVIL